LVEAAKENSFHRDVGNRTAIVAAEKLFAGIRQRLSPPAGAHLRAGCCSTAMMWKEGISALIKTEVSMPATVEH